MIGSMTRLVRRPAGMAIEQGQSIKKEQKMSLNKMAVLATIRPWERRHAPQTLPVLVSHILFNWPKKILCYQFKLSPYITHLLLDDCAWSAWRDSSSCSKSCGYGELSGIKKQRRSKLRSEVFGGKCDNIDTRDIGCTTNIECPCKMQAHLNTIH